VSRPYRPDRKVTLQEYERLPEDSPSRIELSRGLLVREPRPGPLHQRVVSNLHYVLRKFIQSNPTGSVELETEFLLPIEPLTIRAPDLAFIRLERLPAELPPSRWPFAPDLAIEVVSPSNRLSAMQEKIIDYFDAGTTLVWVIDPKSRTAMAYRSAGDVTLLREGDILEGGDVLPGFSIRIRELMEPLPTQL
jgi:Uma2 family endonuclease